MKFIISSSEMLRGAMAVAKAIPAKSPQPILENFLISLKGGSLTLTASDTELTLRTSVEVESGIEDGRIAIPAKQIIDLLKEFPDQPITIATVSESSFECNWNNGTSTLQYFPAEDYPEIAGVGEDSTTVVFPAEVLIEGISSTVYATADDEIRPIMNGILFDIKTDGATLVASDAHKLVCYNTKAVTSEESNSFILHKKPANILKSIVSKDDETVNVTFDSKYLEFTFGQTMAICRLIVGKYPKYREVIPQNNDNILKISRVQLLNIVRRISVCANKASNQIKFELSDDCLEISAQDVGFSIAAYEKTSCSFEGEPVEIGFKSTFLVEILSNMDCEEIVMKFADGRRAVLITPGEDEESKDKICGILMPIMFS